MWFNILAGGLKTIVYILLFGLSFSGCYFMYNSMSEKERNEFEAQCFSQDTVYNLTVKFEGFANSEFDSVLVKEFNKEQLVDSFRIFVQLNDELTERSGYKSRWAEVTKKMLINYSYHFIVPGQKPFVLTEMKIVPMPRMSQFTEGYRCEMANFTVDGTKFIREQYPVFIKS